MKLWIGGVSPPIPHRSYKEEKNGICRIITLKQMAGGDRFLPREQWRRIGNICVGIFSLEIYFGFLRDLAGLFFAVSKGEFLLGLIAVLLVFGSVAYWYLRRARKGWVIAEGLEGEGGLTIPWHEVNQIVYEGDGFPAVVFTPAGREKMLLRDEEFVKLAKTRFDRWEVDGEKVTVTSGEEGQERQINYGPLGKYRTARLDLIGVLILWFAIALLLYSYYESKHYDSNYSVYAGCGLIFLLALFGLFLRIYKKVRVSLEGCRLKIMEGEKGERVIGLNDVARVDRGIFQLSVVKKNGEVIKIPQACALLPELITAFRD